MAFVDSFTQPYMEFIGSPSCAFGGSGALIRRYSRLQNGRGLDKYSILVVKHPDDDPSAGSEIKSSSMSKSLDAFVSDSVDEIARVITPQTHVVMISGAQYYSDHRIVTLCDELVQSGRRVFVTAVTLKNEGTPYNFAGELSAIADVHTYRRPPCYGTDCENLASRSWFPRDDTRSRPFCYKHYPLVDRKSFASHNSGQVGLFRMNVGSMFAEKTEEAAQVSTQVLTSQLWFRYKGDNRRGDENCVKTFNDTAVEAVVAGSPQEIYDVTLDRRLREITIDEPFFFGEGIANVIRDLVLKGTVVNTASVTLSFINTPLPSPAIPETARMLAFADEVHDCYAFCNNHFAHGSCGHPATRSQLVHIHSGEVVVPESAQKKDLIIVGDSVERESSKQKEIRQGYYASCKKHFTILEYPSPTFSFPPIENPLVPVWDCSSMYLHDSPKRNV